MKFISLLLVLFITSTSISKAQEEIPVKAKGKYHSGELSAPEIKAKAIEKAKTNALREAGIEEQIDMVTISNKLEKKGELSEVFEQMAALETKGSILVDTIIETKRHVDKFDNFVIEVELHGKVIKYTKEKNPALYINVEGIEDKSYIKAGEHLKFSVTPGCDGYLTIFNIYEQNAIKLYPYENAENPHINDEKKKLFKTGETVQFPVNESMEEGYPVALEDENASEEINHLIFVFTDDYFTYIDDENYKNIMHWIYELPRNKRDVEYHTITIVK